MIFFEKKEERRGYVLFNRKKDKKITMKKYVSDKLNGKKKIW